MNVISDEDWRKCERASELFDIPLDLVEKYVAGNYRFAERYPAEYAEYRRLAAEFKDSSVPELSRTGFRMERLVLEMNETDRTYQRHNNGSRQTRKQLDLFLNAISKLESAIQALPIGGGRLCPTM